MTDFFTHHSQTNTADRKVRKLLGRSYLRSGRIEEALDVYLGILREEPEDIDILLVFGNLYLIGGMQHEAHQLYSRALALSPHNLLIQKQLSLVQGAQPVLSPALDPLHPEAVALLVERLRSEETQQKWMEIRAAADMLDKILPEESPESWHRLPGDELQRLMPALIEQNIRQARLAGQPELAEALRSLQIHLSQKTNEPASSD